MNAVTRYTHCGQCKYLVNIPEPVQYKIYALALPFDLRCESGTYHSYTMAVRDFADTYTHSPRETGPRGEGVCISKIPSSHGIN